MFAAQRKASVEPFDVFHRIDGYSPFADLAEYAVGIAIEAV